MITSLNSEALVAEADREIAAKTAALGVRPQLIMLEGMGPSDLTHEVNTYVRGKQKIAEKLGVVATHLPVPVDRLVDNIDLFNRDDDTHGLIVESPIPGLSRDEAEELLDKLDPNKAVDNQGINAAWRMGATSEAGLDLLDHYGHTGEGRHVLVVGSGNVGAPMAAEYARRNIRELSVVDVHNKDELPKLAKAADIIIVATGKRNTLGPDTVRPDHVILEIGAGNVHPSVRDISDFDFSITPVKGGVGPLTSRRLLGRVAHLAGGGSPQTWFTHRLVSAEK